MPAPEIAREIDLSAVSESDSWFYVRECLVLFREPRASPRMRWRRTVQVVCPLAPRPRALVATCSTLTSFLTDQWLSVTELSLSYITEERSSDRPHSTVTESRTAPCEEVNDRTVRLA